MASVVINGDTSGGITLSAPAVAGSNTYTLAPATGNITPIVSGTAIASTSGTSVDFVLSSTIAPYVKRVTVMFSGVSTNGTSNLLIQIGDSGGIENTGYVSNTAGGGTPVNSTAGFILTGAISATNTLQGGVQIANVTSNQWVAFGTLGYQNATTPSVIGGGKTLSDTLDRIRITTVNGTDTFDAGTINIMYEG